MRMEDLGCILALAKEWGNLDFPEGETSTWPVCGGFMHCSTSSKAKWVFKITCLSLFNDMLMVWGQTLSSDKVPWAFCLEIFMLHKCWFDTLSLKLSLLKQLNLCSMVCSAIAIGDCNNYLAFVPIPANVARFSEWVTPTSHIVYKHTVYFFLYIFPNQPVLKMNMDGSVLGS